MNDKKLVVAVLNVKGRTIKVFSKLETAVRMFQLMQKTEKDVVLDTHEVDDE